MRTEIIIKRVAVVAIAFLCLISCACAKKPRVLDDSRAMDAFRETAFKSDIKYDDELNYVRLGGYGVYRGAPFFLFEVVTKADLPKGVNIVTAQDMVADNGAKFIHEDLTSVQTLIQDRAYLVDIMYKISYHDIYSTEDYTVKLTIANNREYEFSVKITQDMEMFVEQ